METLGSVKLIQNNEKNSYTLVVKDKKYVGELVDMWRMMNLKWGISNTDIRMAVNSIITLKHNVAYFGIFGSFLGTGKNEDTVSIKDTSSNTTDTLAAFELMHKYDGTLNNNKGE